MFLNKKIKFLDISKTLLKILKKKEFVKYKKVAPTKVSDIVELSEYVSLKVQSLSV